MVISSRSFIRSLTVIAALVLTTPAQAQVTITCDQAHVTSRVPCVLTASHGDGKPRTWRWSVVGLEDPGQLLDTDVDGKTLGHSQSVDVNHSDVVNAPIQGLALLRAVGTAPPGTARVTFGVQVAQGGPGAFVAFQQVP